jgi:hypothetical protein
VSPNGLRTFATQLLVAAMRQTQTSVAAKRPLEIFGVPQTPAWIFAQRKIYFDLSYAIPRTMEYTLFPGHF